MPGGPDSSLKAVRESQYVRITITKALTEQGFLETATVEVKNPGGNWRPVKPPIYATTREKLLTILAFATKGRSHVQPR